MTIIEIKPYEKLEDKKYIEDVILLIKKENFEGIDFIEGRITFVVIDCDFKNLKIENPEKIDFEISISFNNSYIETFNILEISSKKIDFLFHSSIFTGNIKNTNIRSVNINNCILLNNLFLIGLKSASISFTEENVFPIKWKRIIKRINIKNINVLLESQQSYHIEDVEIISFYINEVTNNKIGVSRDKYYQKNDDFKVKYFLSEERKKLFSIGLYIKYPINGIHSKTLIKKAILRSLSIQGNPSGKISVEDSKIQEIYIRELSNENELTLYNISPVDYSKESKFEIHKSNLNNTWFDNIAFVKYTTISFYRTRFNKSVFTSCNFPNDSISFEKFQSLENIHYPESKKGNFYKDQYETFLQLKNALESTGNIHEAQKLQAISYEALKNINDISSWDKLILNLNNLSNGHGLSIWKPLKLFLFTSIVLYIFYLISLGRILNGENFDYKLIGYYFSYIDLTHRNDFLVGKEEFNSFSLFLDFLNKIISGYLIYQFIAAFRKYGKGK